MRFKSRYFSGTSLIAAIFAAIAVCFSPALYAQDGLQTQQDIAAVQATDPVVVVTLGSINKLMQDVNYLTAVVGQPQFGGMFQMMAGTFTQGIDLNQPIGVIVPLVDNSPEPIALVPTANVRTVLKRLEAQTGPADELDDGTLVIAVGANTVYIRQVGQWAALARNRELLDLAPADPSSLFEGMGNDYVLAVRLKMQQVPASTRNQLIEQIRQGLDQAMEQQDQADAESAKVMAENSIEQLEQIIQNTDEIKLGWNLDQSEKQMTFTGSFTAVPGSKLAAMYGGQQAIPSQFADVIRDDAAGFYHAAVSVSQEAVEQTVQSLEMVTAQIGAMLKQSDDLSESQRNDIEALVERIVQLASKSVKEGKADVGALLLADQNDFQFVFGSFVADGNEAAQIVKDLADKLKNEPKAPRFLFDQEVYKGVTLHVVEADIRAKDEEARRMFGETLRVHVGTGEQSVYVAVGQKSPELMKQLIDSSGSDQVGSRPAGQFQLKLLPILQYAQSIETNDTVAAMIDTLSRSTDAGEVRMVQSSVNNGQEAIITITEGLMQAIGAAARQAQEAQLQQQEQF